MSQIIIVVVTVLAIIALSILIVKLFKNFSKRKLSKLAYAFISIGLSLTLLFGAAAIYLNVYYHADETAVEAFSNSESARVTKLENGYFFDGKGKNTALVFYQGAKVQSESYAPLMNKIASRGIDCFVLETPFRLAVLGNNLADKIMSDFSYEHWILGGHSMGGVVASGYAQAHKDNVDGILLLASYSNVELDDSFKLLSVYGDKDGVLNMSAYDRAKENIPENSKEVIIKGGNHAGFGNYGAQNGDNEAEISNEEQQNQTAAAVIEYFSAA